MIRKRGKAWRVYTVYFLRLKWLRDDDETRDHETTPVVLDSVFSTVFLLQSSISSTMLLRWPVLLSLDIHSHPVAGLMNGQHSWFSRLLPSSSYERLILPRLFLGWQIWVADGYVMLVFLVSLFLVLLSQLLRRFSSFWRNDCTIDGWWIGFWLKDLKMLGFVGEGMVWNK